MRRHAAEALNFNLSFLIYAVALGFAALVLLSLSVGVLAVALLTALGIGWLVLVCVAATKAGRHEKYRYPLTIRFVR